MILRSILLVAFVSIVHLVVTAFDGAVAGSSERAGTFCPAPLKICKYATTSRKALFRITANAVGKGGVLGYIGEGDVLWLQTKRQGAFEPVGLDRLVPLAERR